MKIFYPGCAPATPNPAPRSDGEWPTLRQDQLEAIWRIVAEITEPGRSKSVLVGAGMGSGKTVVTVEVMLHSKPRRALVVGVRDSYAQWAKTLREQGSTESLLRINSSVDGRINLARLVNGDDAWFYVGLEFLRSQDWVSETKTTEWDSDTLSIYPDLDPIKEQVARQLNTFRHMNALDLIVSDEAHKHSNQKSASIDTINSIKAKAKIALSGTFFGNKFENAWSLCTWLWGRPYVGTKTAFIEQWCDLKPVMSKDGRTQLKTKGGWPITKVMGEREPGAYVETLPCYVFIATPIGPVPDPDVVLVELGPAQRKQYDEMLDQSLTWVPAAVTQVRAPLVADLPLVQRLRLRTAALGTMHIVPAPRDPITGEAEESDKITFEHSMVSSTAVAAYDVLHRPDWVGNKTLILTHSLPFAEEVAYRIKRKYPGQVALKTGKVSSEQWDRDKASFMANEPDSIKYVVAVISAVGTSTDGLQANCSQVLWLSLDENNVNNIQGSNRVWRDGVDLLNYRSVQIVQRDTIAEGILAKNDSHRAGVMESVTGHG